MRCIVCVVTIALFCFISFQSLDTQQIAEGIKAAWIYFNSGKYADVLNTCISLLQKDPQQPELNLLVGRALIEMKRYVDALPYLDKAVRYDTNNTLIRSWGLAYQGIAFFMVEQYDEAKNKLEMCRDLKLTNDTFKFARDRLVLFGLTDYYKQWPHLESEHFSLHVSPQAKVTAEDYIAKCEKAYADIQSKLNAKIPRRIDLFLWDSKEAALAVLGEKIGFVSPEYCVVHSYYADRPGHDIAHVISFGIDFPNDPILVPLINEGTSVYFDQSGEDKIAIAKAQMAKFTSTPISIDTLWNSWDFVRPEISYPIAGAFVKYLIDKEGIDKFKLLLKNETMDNAKAIYGASNLNALIKSFETQLGF